MNGAAAAPPTAGRPSERLYRVLLRTVRFLLHVLTRRTQVGDLPRTGAVIVVGNHLSVADAFILGAAVARYGRRIRMLGTAGLFKAPVLGPLLRAVGYIPVDRRSPDPSAALGPARAALDAGQCVGRLYPEGAIIGMLTAGRRAARPASYGSRWTAARRWSRSRSGGRTCSSGRRARGGKPCCRC